MSKCCKQNRESTITVSRVFSQSGTILEESSEQEKIVLPNMEGVPMATVSADRAVTKNLSNYNSLRIGVFVSVPCYLEEQEIDRAIRFCVNTAESRIEKDSEAFMSFLTQKYPNIFAALK